VNVQTLGVQEVVNHCGSLAANELKSIADLSPVETQRMFLTIGMLCTQK